MSQSKLLTLKDAATHCSVSVRTVQRWVDEEDLPVIRIKRLVRISAEDLGRFLKRHRE